MASRSTMPSLAALLGLLAVAGYQNRDKLGQLAQGAKGGGGLLGDLGKMFGGGDGNENSLSKGLDDLLNTFRNSGQKETADSWVSADTKSQNLSPSQLENAVGRDTLQELASKTGIDYDDLLNRLSTSIPDAVDRMTPQGKLPQTHEEAQQLLAGQGI